MDKRREMAAFEIAKPRLVEIYSDFDTSKISYRQGRENLVDVVYSERVPVEGEQGFVERSLMILVDLDTESIVREAASKKSHIQWESD